MNWWWNDVFSLELQGLIFRKNLVHVSRKMSHFSFHISLIQKCILSLHISHITFNVKIYNFSFTFIFCILLLIFCTVKCDLWSGKCEMRTTFHVYQMPNVICETNMKREFNFWKNALLHVRSEKGQESWVNHAETQRTGRLSESCWNSKGRKGSANYVETQRAERLCESCSISD